MALTSIWVATTLQSWQPQVLVLFKQDCLRLGVNLVQGHDILDPAQSKIGPAPPVQLHCDSQDQMHLAGCLHPGDIADAGLPAARAAADLQA